MRAGYLPKSGEKTWKSPAGRTWAACDQPPAAMTTNGTARQHASTMMMPFGRSVWATATMPPIATKRITNAAAIVWPSPSEILPSVATFRMYPPARNW